MKLDLFPRKHLSPYDGLPITAEVWAQAHEEHRRADRAHRLHLHGSGIITGLEVQASDPPDQYVFISPGAAIDAAGNLIVVPEPVAYDFSNSAEGLLYLLLAHGEREVGGLEHQPRYRQDEFVISARSTWPRRPSVELARIVLPQTGLPIRNADDPLHPAPGTLDLRFRRRVLARPRRQVYVLAVTDQADQVEDLSAGWDALARAAAQLDALILHSDTYAAAQLPAPLPDYDLLYLLCQEKPPASWDGLLARQLEEGKPLLLEAATPQADAACRSWLKKQNRPLRPLAANTSLFLQPYLFGRPPQHLAPGRLETAPALLYSNAAYALGWRGQSETGWRSREEIRTLHEWGLNLLHYCLEQLTV